MVSGPDGEVLDEFGERIGVATNNVAEYRALLRGLERAAALGAREIEIVNDSELVARQLTGAYKVKHPAMKPLLRRGDGGAARVRSLAGPQRPPGPERPRRRAGQPGARRGGVTGLPAFSDRARWVSRNAVSTVAAAHYPDLGPLQGIGALRRF